MVCSKLIRSKFQVATGVLLAVSGAVIAAGPAKIAQKLGEEAVETVIEGARGNAAGIVAESADLLYHLLVLWADAGVAPAQVWRALEGRAGTSGIDEKKSRPRQ